MNEMPSYALPEQVEVLCAALSKLYARRGLEKQQRLVVNARVRIHEAWVTDNWDGGTYGHAVFLALPESLFLDAVAQKDALQEEIKKDLNSLHSVSNEFFAEVFLEIQPKSDGDWRRDSGVLLSEERQVPPAAQSRIWGDAGYRVFLSHKAEAKKEAANVKAHLADFGIASFVAHEDIQPTKEWQGEIESALASMDAFVALMTKDFHQSLWTDQEVGYAFGRGVPIVSVKLGCDPYGFIGKFQALASTWENAPLGVLRLLLEHSRMIDTYVATARSCPSFDSGNKLASALPFVLRPSEAQVDQLVAAYNENDQLRGSFGFNGTRAYTYGDGLAAHLARVTGRPYTSIGTGPIAIGP